MIYSGIGSRETPHDIRTKMVSIARTHAELGWTLRTGGADGADQAFGLGAQMHKGPFELYLPWQRYNGHNGIVPPFNKQACDMAAYFHPAWGRCTEGAKKMHIRNVYIILGVNLNVPSDFVVCWTPGGNRGGGTGQALRIAEHFKIPIIDLAVDSMDKLTALVNELKERE